MTKAFNYAYFWMILIAITIPISAYSEADNKNTNQKQSSKSFSQQKPSISTATKLNILRAAGVVNVGPKNLERGEVLNAQRLTSGSFGFNVIRGQVKTDVNSISFDSLLVSRPSFLQIWYNAAAATRVIVVCEIEGANSYTITPRGSSGSTIIANNGLLSFVVNGAVPDPATKIAFASVVSTDAWNLHWCEVTPF